MVVFGPVADDTGSFGLAVVEGEEDAVRAAASADPAVAGGMRYEVGTLLTGFVR